MMFVLCLILFIAYKLMNMQKHIRILQLNHYHNDRYLSYVLKGLSFHELIVRVVVHLPFILLMFTQQQLELFVLMLFVYIYVFNKYMICYQLYTLKYTNRILRLCLCISLLYIIILLYIYQTSNFIYYVILLLLFDREIIYIANSIIKPLEILIYKYYIKDAKKILDDCTNLVKIATVGSYGKTSTKNFIYYLLCHHKYALKSKGSYNNLMGNTLVIRKSLKAIHEVFVCELGSDHEGEIKQLMQFIRPNYVVLTSIGNQHLETFKTQHAIIREKTSCLLEMKEKDVAFLNIDNLYIYQNQHKGICKKVTFGKHVNANYRLMDYEFKGSKTSFSVKYKNEYIVFETNLLGYFNLMNMLASISVAHYMGIPFHDIQHYVPCIEPVAHRLESIKKSDYTILDNAFNSNEKSFRNSLDILQRMEEKTILVTPGLIDLKYNDEINTQLLCEATYSCDEIVLVGKLNREAMLKGINKGKCKCFKIVDTMEEALHYLEVRTEKNFIALIENDIAKELMND